MFRSTGPVGSIVIGSGCMATGDEVSTGTVRRLCFLVLTGDVGR